MASALISPKMCCLQWIRSNCTRVFVVAFTAKLLAKGNVMSNEGACNSCSDKSRNANKFTRPLPAAYMGVHYNIVCLLIEVP